MQMNVTLSDGRILTVTQTELFTYEGLNEFVVRRNEPEWSLDGDRITRDEAEALIEREKELMG